MAKKVNWDRIFHTKRKRNDILYAILFLLILGAMGYYAAPTIDSRLLEKESAGPCAGYSGEMAVNCNNAVALALKQYPGIVKYADRMKINAARDGAAVQNAWIIGITMKGSLPGPGGIELHEVEVAIDDSAREWKLHKVIS